MIIVAHRGIWKIPHEQNTLRSLETALDSGFGVETDVRDLNGSLTISHDPPTNGGDLRLSELIKLHSRNSYLTPMALNIKSDGLAHSLDSELQSLAASTFFVFDMSGPETVQYARRRLRFFTRHSEYEPTPLLYDEAAGVWLDSFNSEWFNEGVVAIHLKSHKLVCIVSAELHGRDHRAQWDKMAKWSVMWEKEVMLCTDHPEDARACFGG